MGRKNKITKDCIKGDTIGQGKFGSVWLCRCRVSGVEFACKTLVKGEETVHREVEIMQHLSGHPGVVTLKAVYEDLKSFHLVMELCSGGRLIDQMTKEGRYSEQRAANIFKELMMVIKYCHDMGVVHRDVKPESILLTTSGKIKLANFGFAVRITNVFHNAHSFGTHPCRSFSTRVSSVHGEKPSAEYAKLRKESLESEFEMHLLLGPNVCPCTIVSAPSWHCIEQRIFRMRSSSLLLAIFLFMTLRSVQQRYKYNPFFSDQLIHFVNCGSLGLANDFLSLGFLPEGVDMQLVPKGVDMVFMILDGMLVRPYGLFSTIHDCVGATIAWPCPFISVVRED